MWSANKHGIDGWTHMDFWTESWANYKSNIYFNKPFSDVGQYIIRNISAQKYIWLTYPRIFPFKF